MSEGVPLEIRDLAVSGDEGRPILTLPALSLQPGRSLGVRGPSGSGKTTFIFAVAGLTPGAAGIVAWGDTDILRLSTRRRRAFRAARIGLVFQDFLLFEELGPEANAGVSAYFKQRSQRERLQSRAIKLLEQMGVPAGRRTSATLSGGERQRVAIARALSTNPAILLADEPTASLHREAADQVIDDLVAQSRDGSRTLIVASHDERLLARMDETIVLEGGRRAAE